MLSTAVAAERQSARQPPAHVPTALELFAGAGGLALGFHQAGFELVDLLEFDEACCETLRANAPHLGWIDPLEIDARDVRTVDFSSYEGLVTVLTAGAPCQPFSRGSRGRLGRLDTRNMLPEVVRAVSEIRPQAFVIENVRGLLFADAVTYLNAIVALLRNPDRYVEGVDPEIKGLAAEEPGDEDEYRVEYRLLDAADFGLAQHRPRLFIVGVGNDGTSFDWPVGQYSRASLIEDLREGQYWQDHPDVSYAARDRARVLLPQKPLKRSGQRWRTLRDLLVELGPPAQTPDAAEDPCHVLVRGARLYGKHTGSRIDWVGKTVKAGVHGSPGGEHIVVSSPKRFRYLTVRECAALQGFPRDYCLPGLRTPAMRQLGNAVPVDVARAIAVELRRALQSNRS